MPHPRISPSASVNNLDITFTTPILTYFSFDSKRGMEGDTFNGAQIDAKIMQTFKKNFVQVQDIFDQNRLLINEINQNHESKVPDNLTRNVGLIRELNNNIRRVYDLYVDLSSSFTKSMEVTSEGDSSGGAVKSSDGKAGHKRHRPV
ncbi:Protein ELF4-LIKE 3 [Glycine soja]